MLARSAGEFTPWRSSPQPISEGSGHIDTLAPLSLIGVCFIPFPSNSPWDESPSALPVLTVLCFLTCCPISFLYFLEITFWTNHLHWNPYFRIGFWGKPPRMPPKHIFPFLPPDFPLVWGFTTFPLRSNHMVWLALILPQLKGRLSQSLGSSQDRTFFLTFPLFHAQHPP